MSADELTGAGDSSAAGPNQPQRAMLFMRMLGGDYGAAQVWFQQEVLDRYREQAGSRVIRTNSSGRVRSVAGWSLDFGITSDDRLIHTAIADLAQRLPPSERQHWVQHVVAPATSGTFLTMRLGAASCIDDGEVRSWSK